MPQRRVLIVDDEDSMLKVCAAALSALPDLQVVPEQDSQAAAIRLAKETFDLLLTDLQMPGLDGLGLMRVARQHDPLLPMLVLTGYPTVGTAVESMKLGATEYLSKPFQAAELAAKVGALLETRRLREENRLLRRQVERSHCCGQMLGRSAAMQRVCGRIQQSAETDFDVLIVGETGTGKELVAHAIHQRSRRNQGPFVPVNCGAIPDDLMESEFFGHERGAFTGAQARSLGLFEYAAKGTLFLDELNQLPVRLQGKLLRVLQERRIRRVGGAQEIDVDVRVVAASSMSLEAEVKQGRFRPDLYHRINVARVDLPPLRDRAEDIPILVTSFLERYAAELQRGPFRLSPEALEVLISYAWPGNVRELQNVVKRALAWAHQDVIGVEDLPDEIVAQAGEQGSAAGTGFFVLRERKLVSFEQDYFRTLLHNCDGDVSTAAKEARLPRGTLYRLLKKHDINPAEFRRSQGATA